MTSSSSRPVDAVGVARRYGRRVALDGVGLEVERGEIVGLVGPNGAGKTSLLKCLAGFLRPHAGRLGIFGRDPHTEREAVMARSHFVFAPPALFGSLTAREHVAWVGALGARRGARPDAVAVERALAATGLTRRADDGVRTLSFGMRQRLALALALVPRPELLVLDEPTDGLDPLGTRELRGLLRRLADEGMAVLLSSHLLVEVEQLVDRMLVLAAGRGVFFGTPAELAGPADRARLTVSDAGGAVRELERLEWRAAASDGAAGRVDVLGADLTLERARSICARVGIELRGFERRRPSLEEALLRLLEAGEASRGGGRE